MSERVAEMAAAAINVLSRPPTRANTIFERTLGMLSSTRANNRKRGRNPKTCSWHVFLLNKAYEYLPPTTELDRLNRNLLGSPMSERPGLLETMKKKSEFSLNITMEELEDQLIAKYPDVPLARIGFHLARVNEGKKIEVIRANTVDGVRHLVKNGKLWLIPKREISLPLSENADDSVANEESRDTELCELDNVTEGADNREGADRARAGEDQSEDDFVVPPLRRLRRRVGTRRAAIRCRNTVAEYAAAVHRRIPENSSSTQNLISTSNEYIEVLDSEDEELQQVLDASSMEIINQPLTPETGKSFSDLLLEYQGKVNLFDTQEIIISRRNVLKSCFRALRRPSFDLNCKLYVKFSGEMGMDHGGPRRELFRLAVNELMASSLFEGPANGKTFAHNIHNLDTKEYQLAGRLVGLSLAQDGPGISLNPDLYQLMTRGPDVNVNTAFDLDLIPDEDARNKLKQLKEVRNADEMDTFLAANGEWMLGQGFTNTWRLKFTEVNRAVATLIKQLIFYRTSAEINQFTSGVNEVFGLWDTVKKDPACWSAVFCTPNILLSKESFMDQCSISWSLAGSNRRLKEEESIYSWEVFLQDIGEKTVPLTFEELLVFCTGADKIPPAGFPSKISIMFYEVDAEETRLPSVSTCALHLNLPRGSTPENLTSLFLRAVKESEGFGKI
ncbi:G2/M phase-specific E3 ubiquitin-protein ligase-like [Mizuhopecten yessoensis]|uniref:HECT-type E3 ubiquitin transferase n=1 Tax=Mizuhopecten yessoensis TaxID=6573 RepID=A0A210QXQ6_MIZYE|nr:G2/M phase-specific E3 ubiquitin-protein ligase-like [Mizuhopecten yessoensis]OWF53493.1 G2/M phase-specific E3 ubiquitin-protein ligase [Mizuhopecten yessoensis]